MPAQGEGGGVGLGGGGGGVGGGGRGCSVAVRDHSCPTQVCRRLKPVLNWVNFCFANLVRVICRT